VTVLKLFGALSATELQTDPVAKTNCERIDFISYRWNSHRIFELAAVDTFASEDRSGKVNTSRSEILCRTQLVLDDDKSRKDFEPDSSDTPQRLTYDSEN
jgi:hypothetical protein